MAVHIPMASFERGRDNSTSRIDMTNNQTSQPIERRDNLGYFNFVSEYLRPNRPVIITNGLNAWRAKDRWTPDFFRKTYGDKVVHIDRDYRLADYINLVEASTPERPAPYLFHLFIDENFPELLDDIHPLPIHLAPNWLGQKFLPGKVGHRIADHHRPGVFIGGLASKCAKLHYDFNYHSFSFQLFGRKRFWLYSPDQTPLMYADPDNKCLSQVVNLEQPDLAKQPLFAKARAFTCDLEAGEFIFVPAGWWHSTRMLSVSISVSINTANSSNWPDVVRELYVELKPRHKWLARPFAGYMRLVGAGKGLRDRMRSEQSLANSDRRFQRSQP